MRVIKSKQEKYTLLLRVAEINFQLNIHQKTIFFFLKKKYCSYISSYEQAQVIIEIYSTTTSRRFVVNEGDLHFGLYCSNISRNFSHFNDLFLVIFVETLPFFNGVALHASTVIRNDNGLIFIGPSGAGKSTLRILADPLESLGDDLAIIRIEKNKFYLYGSPFYQRTKMSYPNKKIIISGIFVIKQRKHAALKQLLSFDGFISLKRNCFSVNPEKVVNNILLQISKKNLLYELEFEKNKDFLEIISQKNKLSLLQNTKLGSLTQNINSGVKIVASQYRWYFMLANQSFVNNLFMINELSWVFEFEKNKRVLDIVDFVINSHSSLSSHASFIKSLIDEKKMIKDFVVICLRRSDGFEIIDGNHRVVASSVMNMNKSRVYKILYAEK